MKEKRIQICIGSRGILDHTILDAVYWGNFGLPEGKEDATKENLDSLIEHVKENSGLKFSEDEIFQEIKHLQATGLISI